MPACPPSPLPGAQHVAGECVSWGQDSEIHCDQVFSLTQSGTWFLSGSGMGGSIHTLPLQGEVHRWERGGQGVVALLPRVDALRNPDASLGGHVSARWSHGELWACLLLFTFKGHILLTVSPARLWETHLWLQLVPVFLPQCGVPQRCL